MASPVSACTPDVASRPPIVPGLPCSVKGPSQTLPAPASAGLLTRSLEGGMLILTLRSLRKNGRTARSYSLRGKQASLSKSFGPHMVAYLVLALMLFMSCPNSAWAADLPSIAGFDSASLAAGLGEWIRGDTSGLGAVPFIATHITAIVLCFPGTALFELTAGAVFGFLPGVGVVATAKGLAAALTFFLARAARDGAPGRWIQDRLNREGQGWTEKIQRGVRRDAFRFCLLARLSPVPSWINNYALPLAGVPLTSFLPATLTGMIPPLASNVYSGSAAASLAEALSRGTSVGFDWVGVSLGILSALSGAAIVQQLASIALEEDPAEDS